MPLAAAAPVSQQDRDALIKDLENSRKVFLDAIADVKTEAQWNYKPAPDRWSVAECAAHIIAAEQYFRDNIAARSNRHRCRLPSSRPPAMVRSSG